MEERSNGGKDVEGEIGLKSEREMEAGGDEMKGWNVMREIKRKREEEEEETRCGGFKLNIRMKGGKVRDDGINSVMKKETKKKLKGKDG